MRNRHFARVCRNCQAPIASKEVTCWRCGVEWASEPGPRTTLRLIPAAAPSDDDVVATAPAAAVAVART